MPTIAREWSDDCIVADHRELQANTLALDCTGQYAVLAGRRHMGIVNLDNPSKAVCKVNRNSKWDVTSAQWSPVISELFAISCNQRAELYNWQDGNVLQHASLQAHTRSISDLDWAVFDSNVIATASIDTYVHVWDIRDYRKPASSLSSVAGASQVKWNKVLPHSVATAHEGDIRLWDTRKYSNPIKYITAHLSKIHSVDWCPTEDNLLATASQDCTVKFWDVTSPQKKDEMISLRCPVWRAKYTPFSNGLVTAVVPPLRRGDNSLFFWNISDISAPVHTFLGHTDVITEFGWRKQTQDSKDYQLVTWSKDQNLRLWTVDENLQKSCISDDDSDNDGMQEKSDYFIQDIDTKISERVAEVSETSSVKQKRQEQNRIVNTPSIMSQPQNLQQEFSLVNLNIPNMTIDEMDATKRMCVVTAENGKNVVCLKLKFPESYPFNAAPTFVFCRRTNVDEKTREKLSQVLNVVSKQQVRRNRSCLEPCLRQLVNTLTTCTSNERPTQLPSDSPYHRETAISAFGMYGFQDVSVPFPRTSGARFCGSDLLVVFTRPPHLQRINAPTDVTPRSLSALAAYLSSHVLPMKPRGTTSSPAQYTLVYPPITHSPSGDATVSISSFYHQDRKRKVKKSNSERASGPKSLNNCGAVLVYSVTKLMPISRNLAQNYVLHSNDIYSSCVKNANVAAAEGFDDLVQVWLLCSVIGAGLSVPEYGSEGNAPLSIYPFGRQIIKSLISHFIGRHDVQTAAMLTCIFQSKPYEKLASRMMVDINNSSGNISPGGSPYHTVVPADLTWENWILGANLKRNRSNSWSDSLEDYKLMESGMDYRDSEKPSAECYTKFLDPNMAYQYALYKKAYADMLHRWNLLDQRAQVLKYLTVHEQSEKRKGIEFVTECQSCHSDVVGPQCSKCKQITLRCVVCHLGVKGLGSYCLSCGHGGHTPHLEEWFSTMDVCPTGCGCHCFEGTNIFGT